MLDTDTKRRIDTARDLLVGKVPDPKSQVEQITIALIYKFMDDMDAEAEELGGKRKFFSGDYGKYGWAKLMQPGIGGHELLALYADGIDKMPENPGIPALFRDIFKNAYLPYRDPETLKSFLKVINDFTYDHSERLGDAFEYLLSVLGSQGDAGQFRTPRHIIDFIVEILAPRKEESLLDPACGTAGFLISAYKHILRTNTDARGNSTLTPDEKGRLAKKFNGYDISPDMVRLSLVNLYLHGFTDPHIFEYDSLTDTARWNEYADVILANPPFMSPKGGIRPHNRFSIQAKRSEVLFVDYIAEHLTPNGRAGIIVPEGIIFQSQNAYKDLRKMLVENSLVAVISLPAGCFNPYSGVKTSILLLDKSLARQSDTVAFFKVENDGYDLGAQRRPIQKNDLPKVQEDLESYLATLRERKDPSELALTTALVVPKEKIAANGDYNLSGERYREGGNRSSSFPLRRFEDVCTLEYGSSLPKDKRVDGPYPVVGSNGVTGYHNEFIVDGPAIVIGRKGSAGEVTFIAENCFPIDTTYFVKQTNPEESDIRFLYWLLKTLNLPELRGGAGIPGLNRTDVYEKYQIPLPPLEIQKEIVAEIDGYQKVINGARAVLENYRPHIPINPDWPMVELGEICNSFQYGSSRKSSDSGEVVCLRMGNIQNGEIDWSDLKFAPADEEFDKYLLFPNDVLFNRTNSPIHVGKTGIYRGGRPAVFAGYLIRLNYQKDKVVGPYLNCCLNTKEAKDFCSRVKTDGINQSNINAKVLQTFSIPLPALAEQQAIVAEIEAEQNLVNANRELITRFEAKIQTTLSRIWGE
jgi:type I restriction enzyme M protein